MLYSTVQCSTVQYSAVQYSTVQYSTVQYSAAQCSAVEHSHVIHINIIHENRNPFKLRTLLLYRCHGYISTYVCVCMQYNTYITSDACTCKHMQVHTLYTRNIASCTLVCILYAHSVAVWSHVTSCTCSFKSDCSSVSRWSHCQGLSSCTTERIRGIN